MKKLLIILICLPIIGLGQVNPCVPNLEFQDSVFGSWPDTIQNLPLAYSLNYYESVIQIKTPTSAGEVPNVPAEYANLAVDSIRLVEVQGLPDGIEISCNTPSCVYNSNEVGCISVYGNPTIVDNYDLNFVFDGWITVFGAVLAMSDVVGYFEVTGYKLIVIDVVTYNCIEGSCIEVNDGTGTYESLEDCETQCIEFDPTWNCSDNFACIEVNDGTGEYASLADCETQCEEIIDPTWKCYDGDCYEIPDGTGEYTSLTDCEEQCEEVVSTWKCTEGTCQELIDGSGPYTTIDECEAVCVSTEDTWDCIDNSCVGVNDGTGLFNTIEGCQEFCNTTSIKGFNNSNKKLKKITNLLGQETPIRKNSPMFYIYDDGTVEKKIIIE